MTQHLLSYGRMVEDLTLAGNFSIDADTTTGLTFGHTGGYIIALGNTRNIVAAGTVALADDETNWVYETDIAIATNSGATPTRATVLYKVTTASGVITAIIDYRGCIVTDKPSFT